MNNFNEWLERFVEEKEIDPQETFEFEHDGELHSMPYGCVIEGVMSARDAEKIRIKQILLEIDYRNGDVKDYFRHLGHVLS
jgi:hypothetical protein